MLEVYKERYEKMSTTKIILWVSGILALIYLGTVIYSCIIMAFGEVVK